MKKSKLINERQQLMKAAGLLGESASGERHTDVIEVGLNNLGDDYLASIEVVYDYEFEYDDTDYEGNVITPGSSSIDIISARLVSLNIEGEGGSMRPVTDPSVLAMVEKAINSDPKSIQRIESSISDIHDTL